MQGGGDADDGRCVRTALCFAPSGWPAAAVCARATSGWSLLLWELQVALGHLGVARGGWSEGLLGRPMAR